MNIYKHKTDYARNRMHIQTANKYEKKWQLEKVFVDWKKVWYIDIYEINLVLAQKISLLNKKK